MLFYYIIILILLVSKGFGDEMTDTSIRYFTEYNVKYICLLTCHDKRWAATFVKRASSSSMSVSAVDINVRFLELDQFDKCMTQRLPIGVLLDAKCNNLENVLNYASTNKMLDSKHKWLIFDYERNNTTNVTSNLELQIVDNYTDEKQIVNATENTSLVLLLDAMNMSVDTDVTIAKSKGNGMYDLYEVYNFGKIQGGSMVIKKMLTINGVNGFRCSKSYVYYRRWEFNGLVLKMVVVMSPKPDVFDPEVILGRLPDPRCSAANQCSSQMLHVISDIHKFKYSYSVSDRWVGTFLRNSTYTATNALYFGDADITPILRVNPLSFDKVHMVQMPVTNLETRFYYRIPSYGIGKFENQFLTPLSPGTWWCVAGVCVICGIVLLGTSLFEGRPFSFPFAFFSVLALVCQQFFEDTDEKGIKRTSSARKLTILITGMSCVLIYNYYTSSVVSWLLNGPPPSINSLWELVNSPLQPIFEDIGYTRSWLEIQDFYYNKRNADAEDKMKQKMYSSIKKRSIFKSIDEGIEMVKQGGYAYHTEVNGANERISRTFDQRELCDLDSLESIGKTILYAAVQKNSPYREFFSWSLMHLSERGIMSCIRNRILPRESKCEGSSPRALALGGAAPAFILLAGGYVLGITFMLLERFIYYRIST